MQPGKPQGFGLVGEERVPIFTLPGNPVSSYVSFETFVLPAIRKLMGRTPYSRPDDPGPADPPDLLARGAPAVRAGRLRGRPGRAVRLPGRAVTAPT